MSKSLVIGVLLVIGLSRCGETNDESGALSEKYAATDETKIRTTSKLPEEATNPKGGVVENQVTSLSPEENIDRVRKNKGEPMVFGASVANITMQTSLEEARKILSSPLGISDDMYFYSENLRVVWTLDEATGKQLPELVLVDMGYLGALQLPEKFGTVKMGSAMSKYFPDTDPFGEEFIKELAKIFDKKDESYDCLRVRKCGIQLMSEHVRFIFQSGDLFFRRNDGMTLDIVAYVPPPPPETPPITDPIIFGTGAAGITFDNSREEVLAKLGTPLAVDFLGIHQFDNGNLEIFFDSDTDKVRSITLRIGYEGSITLPSSYGTLKLGDSLADYFTADDPLAKDMMKELGQFFDGKTADASYDCEIINACGVQSGIGVLFYSFDLGEMIVSDDALTQIEMLTLVPPPTTPRTTPLTLAATFPDTLGGFNMTSSKTDVEAALGASRGTFNSGGDVYEIYDNENIFINFDGLDPNTPTLIQINPNYQGELTFPAAYGTVNMKHGFAAQFPGSDISGEEFLKELYIFYTPETAGYDCVASDTCAVSSDLSFIYFLFKDLGRFIFDGVSKELLYVIYDEEQELPSN